MARYEFIAVYILANKRNGTLYTGVTSNLIERMRDHKAARIEGFAQKCGCNLLVWYEDHDEMLEAIKREKQIKRWRRKWKLDLIEGINPTWRDIYPELFLPPPESVVHDISNLATVIPGSRSETRDPEDDV